MGRKRSFRLIIVSIIMGIIMMLSSVPAFASDADAVDVLMYNNINQLRAANGLNPLEFDSNLVGIAAIRSAEASIFWSHTRPSGERGVSMMDINKWRGENLSYVTFTGYYGTEQEQQNAANVMFNNLCNSPTHLNNMIFASYTKVGISTTKTQTPTGTKLTTAYMFSN